MTPVTRSDEERLHNLGGRSPSFRAAGWASAMATLLPGSLWMPMKEEVGGGDQESSGSDQKTIIFVYGIMF